MIDLKSIPVAEEKPSKKAAINLADLVAAPNTRPAEWQTISKPPVGWSGRIKPPVLPSADLKRIVELPRRPKPTPVEAQALLDLMTERYSNGRPPGQCRCAELAPGRPCIVRLRLVQAWGLYEIGLRGGMLGPINVGDGKTVLDLLAPLALADCKTALLLVPANLLDQLVLDYQLVAQHFRVPSIVVHGRGWSARVPGAPVLHATSYTKLQNPSSTTFLETLRPDAIIADECDGLRNVRGSVRTQRVLQYFGAHPDTRFCGWTGSLTDSSLKDYGHLSALALRYGSPLPLDPAVVDDWARAIDPPKNEDDAPAPMGALEVLCEPGETLHSAFHRRLTETAGVVTSTAPSVDAELSITERAAPPIPQVVADSLRDLRANWTRPDGEELVDALAFFRCARELACGFYYRWVFRNGETVAQIEEWLEARKLWRQEIRRMLKRPEAHLDSPALLARAAVRAEKHPEPGSRQLWWAPTPTSDEPLPHWRAEHFARWRAAKPLVNGGKLPDTEPVRLDPYLAEDAAGWGQSNRGIIWYASRAFGAWVAELSKLPLHGGGPDAGERIGLERGDRSIIASIPSHGRGRNGLQYLFSDQLVAHPPASATAWEQMLGRLHRSGQKADVVTAQFYRHTPELARHVDQALARAFYVESTLGAEQKLRLGWAVL